MHRPTAPTELILQQTGRSTGIPSTLVSDSLDVGAGPSPSQGESSVTDSIGNTQTIFFYNLSPIFDSLPSPVLNHHTVDSGESAQRIQRHQLRRG